MQVATSQEVNTRVLYCASRLDDGDECFKKYHIVFCDSQKNAICIRRSGDQILEFNRTMYASPDGGVQSRDLCRRTSNSARKYILIPAEETGVGLVCLIDCDLLYTAVSISGRESVCITGVHYYDLHLY